MMERPAIVTDEHLEFLDALRDSKDINMSGAGRYLESEFPELSGDHPFRSSPKASQVLTYWRESFTERHPPLEAKLLFVRSAGEEIQIRGERQNETHSHSTASRLLPTGRRLVPYRAGGTRYHRGTASLPGSAATCRPRSVINSLDSGLEKV